MRIPHRCAQLVFFIVHSAVYIVAYLIPQFVFWVVARGPISSLERWLGDERTFLPEHRMVRVVANWSNRRVAAMFGADVDYFTQGLPEMNGHISTILASFSPLRRLPHVQVQVVAPDGCTLCVDISRSPVCLPQGVFLILPGLASCSNSAYIKHFVAQATVMGFDCAVLLARGMGDSPLNAPQLMSGAWTADLRHIVDTCLVDPKWRAEHFGSSTAPVFAIGFSLGGNVLCKYLGEEGKGGRTARLPIAAAFAICTPWDFHESSAHMRKMAAMVLYQPVLIRGLKDYMCRHKDVVEKGQGLETVFTDGTVSGLRTVHEFDEEVVCPHFGYPFLEAYYSDAMSFPWLDRCPIPLLCIGCLDDPVTGPPPHWRRWDLLAQRNPNIVYFEYPKGGHLGFLSNPVRNIVGDPNAMEDAVLSAAASVATVHATKTKSYLNGR